MRNMYKTFFMFLAIVLMLGSIIQVSVAERDNDEKGDEGNSKYKTMERGSHESDDDKESDNEYDKERNHSKIDSEHEEEADDNKQCEPSARRYKWERVQLHNQSTDCWIVLFQNVYDITPLIQDYGFTLECGTDQTALYQSMYRSDLTMMEPYFLGMLKGGSSQTPNNPPQNPPQPPAPDPVQLSINPIPAKTTTVGTGVAFTATAAGGTAPRTFSLTGTVPSGAAINSATGAFSWTPGATGVYSFNVRVTDSASATADAPVTITVNAAPTPTYTLSQVQLHNTNSNCWVVVFSKVYDITPLTSGHSGGNVFSCGTDMTTLYQSVHGSNTARMIPYFKGNLA